MPASRSLTVFPHDLGCRLDAFLAEKGCYASRSSAARHIAQGDVFVNGSVGTKSLLLSPGDTVVYTKEEQSKHIVLEGQEIPLDIRYEDDWIIVISKQAGLCVHPSEGHEDSTLVNALIHRYGRDRLAHIQGDDRPGIVHRLDMDTSGLMLCAKDDAVGLQLQESIREREIDRRYIALVHGNIAHDTGNIDAPIARCVRQRIRMEVSDAASARHAETTFKVLERFEAGPRDDGYTLLECKLSTGRTHQIRVHMEYIGHCVVGDPLYCQGSDAAQMGLNRQFLHSYALAFDHPVTQKHFDFVDTMPQDISSVLSRLKTRSMGCTEQGIAILADIASAPFCRQE